MDARFSSGRSTEAPSCSSFRAAWRSAWVQLVRSPTMAGSPAALWMVKEEKTR